MPLPASLRPLRHRDFAVLSTAGLVSHVGSWMQTVAVGALLVDATGQALWAAAVAAAQFLPLGALSPIGGALADRWERRRFMVGGYVALTLLTALLAALAATDRASPGVVVFVVFLTGSVGALVYPFHQAILPELVPRQDLVAAVSLGAAEYNMGRVVGPALAGVLVAAGSFTLVFAVNAITFLVVAVAVALIDVGPPPRATEERIFASIVQGARAVRREPACRSAILLIAATALLVSPFIALLPAMADVLTGGGEKAIAKATGALTTSQGVGAVVGALVLAPLASRLGTRRTVLLNVAGVVTGLLWYSSASTISVAVAAIFVVGIFYIGILNGLGAIVQLAAPAAYRGRILSLFFVALGLVYPIGAVLHGALADRVGLREVSAGGALALIAVVALAAVLRPAWLAAFDVTVVEEDLEEAAGEGITSPAAASGAIASGGSPVGPEVAGAAADAG